MRSQTNITAALKCLHATLQDMSVDDRRREISEMPIHLQRVLLSFMMHQSTKPHVTSATPVRKRKSVNAPQHQFSLSASRPARVCAKRSSRATRYQATTKFKALRLYTREHATREAAREHQNILTQLRGSLSKLERRDPCGWMDAAGEVAEAVLVQHGTTEAALGLRAFVDLRASRHLGQHRQVSSQASSVSEACAAYKRLLHGRAGSWDAFRAEWLHQLQARRTKLSKAEALQHIDEARRAALRGRAGRAVEGIKHALGEPECEVSGQQGSDASPQEGGGVVQGTRQAPAHIGGVP